MLEEKEGGMMRTTRRLSAVAVLLVLSGVVVGCPGGPHQADATIPVGAGASALAVDAQVGHAFVANTAERTVTMFDTASGAVLRTLTVGQSPAAVVVDAHTRRAFVLDHGDDGITMLDTATGAVQRRIQVPDSVALA